MATLTGKKVQDTYKDLLQVSNSNSGVDATMRAVEDGEGTATLLYLSTAGVAVNTGLNIGAATAVTGGKVTQTAALSAATGNEIAYSLAYTTNKSGSGDDTGLQIVQTDTASPGTSYLIDAKVGATSKFSVNNAGTVISGAANEVTAFGGGSTTTAGLSFYGNYPLFGKASTWIMSADEANGPFVCANGAWGFHSVNYASGWVGGGSVDTTLRRVSAGVIKIGDAAGTTYGGLVLDANTQQFADTVTLTDNTLTALFDVALADTAMVGGTLHYTIKVVDATPNYQVEHGTVNFMGFNKATAYTTDLNVASSQILGSGTLATAFTISTGTNLITLNVTSNSSLTPTAFTLTYQLFLNHSGALTKKT